MRGGLHLLPLCVYADEGNGEAGASTITPATVQQEAVHPIPLAASAATATTEALSSATSGRLVTILASVQSDIV